MQFEKKSLVVVQNASLSIGNLSILKGLSFTIEQQELVAIVGESGSGKSMTALMLMGLQPKKATLEAELLTFESRDLTTLTPSDWQKRRGNTLGMVFQEPQSSLNPTQRCGKQLLEVLKIHRNISSKEGAVQVTKALEEVQLHDTKRILKSYPHELSGGQKQRIMIAMALLCKPKLLIADEPTTALDVTVQAQIFDLLNEIQRDFGAAIVLITHDMGAISEMADRVAVMYAGRVIEEASADQVLDSPQHPYARGLIDCIPALGKQETELREIPGVVPPLHMLGQGCAFKARCAHARPRCGVEKPLLHNHGAHPVACHGAEEGWV